MNDRAPQIALATLIVALEIAAGVWTYRSRHPALSQPRTATLGTRVSAGEASTLVPSDFDPALDPALVAPKIPDLLPAFTLADPAGKATPISTWHNKSLVINFWATWCAPCRREIPLLETLYRQWGGRNVEVVGIAVDHPDHVRAFADQLKITYPLLVGEQDALDVATAFGVESPVFPFTVFTDRRGEVVALFVGELHQPQADLILSVVQNLDQNHMQLREARSSIATGLQALISHNSG